MTTIVEFCKDFFGHFNALETFKENDKVYLLWSFPGRIRLPFWPSFAQLDLHSFALGPEYHQDQGLEYVNVHQFSRYEWHLGLQQPKKVFENMLNQSILE